MTRPWFRMYREERGTFAQLPFVARAVFREILTLTDDAGVIVIGRKDPAEAVAFALGADRSDRRTLNRVMPLLLEDGCLVHEGQTLRAPNFPRFQGDNHRPLSNHSPTTLEPLTGHEETLTDKSPTSTDDLSVRNDVLAQNVLSSERREEKNRGEERENARATPADPPPQPKSPNGVRAEALRVGYVQRFERSMPTLRVPSVAQPMSGGPWLELARELTDEQVPALLDAFFADADPFVAKDRAPTKLASQRVRLLTQGPLVHAKSRRAATAPMTHDEARAYVESKAGKGATVHVEDF